MDKPGKRSRHFVDPSVQGALARRILFHWLVFIGAGLFVALFMQYVSDPFQPLRYHMGQIWEKNSIFLVVMFLLLPVFVLDSVKLSNRFAGPVVRLRNTINDMASGKPYRPVSFRKGDFWISLAGDFNRMVERLQAENAASVAAAKAHNTEEASV